MSRRRRRGLDDDDLALWAQVARSARPLRAAPSRLSSDAPDLPQQPGEPPRPIAAPVQVPVDFRVGAAARQGAVSTTGWSSAADRPLAQPRRIDTKLHRRLGRGKLAPEARIDLHGMTLAVAKPALTRFLLDAHAAGRRLVLVITGKGRGDHGPLPTRAGALRHEVPHWLEMPPLNGIVLQVVTAHLRHGGAGAYYVYLSRLH
ncbi:Smr/MutS family protein [uncultured Paracoccus sp.]|uniref:Smr/MutS family protein n=1 Tax=uncultured Paracoccus sp. TaxID=189685 RepID=UPI002613D476|nr:Smr/MutS family protein [uncultured Paracoccus sp.]